MHLSKTIENETYEESNEDYSSKKLNSELENISIWEQMRKEKCKNKIITYSITLPIILRKDQVFEMSTELNADKKDIVMYILHCFKNIPINYL